MLVRSNQKEGSMDGNFQHEQNQQSQQGPQGGNFQQGGFRQRPGAPQRKADDNEVWRLVGITIFGIVGVFVAATLFYYLFMGLPAVIENVVAWFYHMVLNMRFGRHDPEGMNNLFWVCVIIVGFGIFIKKVILRK